MAVEQDVGWRVTRPFDYLVTTLRTRLEGRKSPLSEARGQRDERERKTARRKNDRNGGVLLSPREHVLQLLAQNGGRMKQSAIVSSVDWSESTVSRKLGSLEDAGDVVRYRIGREKLVFLPGAEPDSFGSSLHQDDERQKLAA